MPALCQTWSVRPVLLLAALALLSACEDKAKVVVKPDAKVTVVTTPKGATVTTSDDEAGLEAPKDLPAFAPVYPGAVIRTQISDVAGRDGEAKGLLLVLLTQDPVAKVAAFYDGKAKAAGVKPAMIVDGSDSAVRIIGSADEKAEGALIAISKSDDGAGTEIVITSGVAREQVETWEKADFKDVPRAMPRLQ
jgi:hypothetical protein